MPESGARRRGPIVGRATWGSRRSVPAELHGRAVRVLVISADDLHRLMRMDHALRGRAGRVWSRKFWKNSPELDVSVPGERRRASRLTLAVTRTFKLIPESSTILSSRLARKLPQVNTWSPRPERLSVIVLVAAPHGPTPAVA